MRCAAAVIGVLLATTLAAPASAQQDRPWWAGFDLGAGQLKLSSDKQQGSRGTTFAMGFTGGHRLTQWSRAGLHVNGWLMQAFNLNDPTVGESVSTVNGIIDVFPVKTKPLFVRGGGGLSMYSNNHPSGTNGSGPGWEVGGGYEFRMHGNMGIVPMVQYASGSLGNGLSAAAPGTGLRYSVVEFKAAFIFRFGGTRR